MIQKPKPHSHQESPNVTGHIWSLHLPIVSVILSRHGIDFAPPSRSPGMNVLIPPRKHQQRFSGFIHSHSFRGEIIHSYTQSHQVSLVPRPSAQAPRLRGAVPGHAEAQWHRQRHGPDAQAQVLAEGRGFRPKETRACGFAWSWHSLRVGEMKMNPRTPLKGNHMGMVGVIPSFPAKHQQVLV